MIVLSDWGIWLLTGFGLLILEILLPGIFLMWWGLAAIFLSGLAALLTISFTLQASLFALISILLSLICWRYQHRKDVLDDQSSPLNQREQDLLGMQGIIVEILENGIARGGR